MNRIFKIWILGFLLGLPLQLQALNGWHIHPVMTNQSGTLTLNLHLSNNGNINPVRVQAVLTDFDLQIQDLSRSGQKAWTGSWILPAGYINREVYQLSIQISNRDGSTPSTNLSVFYPALHPWAREGWPAVIQFLFLCLLMALATFLKRVIPFFQKYLVPNAIIAGFLGLLLGYQVLNIIPFSENLLLNLVYHLMAIGFIALALQEKQTSHKSSAVPAGAYIVSTYLIQAVLGLGLMLIILYLFDPQIFAPMGLLLPLGYGQGPGQAFSIGSKWESLIGPGGVFRGLPGGGNIGVSIATMGFLWATFGGVIVMNFMNRRKINHEKESHIVHKNIIEIEKKGDVPLTESIDRMTIQLFLIGLVYLLSYFTLVLLSRILPGLGDFGTNLARMFWGFHFVFGTVYALLLRWCMKLLKKRKLLKRNYPNNYILHRIAGTSFDLMITASIAAISIRIFLANWVPILLMSLLGGVVTLLWVRWIARRYYPEYTREYTLAMFGMLTGTIPTGMALLKEVDPNLDTPVSRDLVEGSGTALVFGIPILLLLPVVVKAYTHQQPGLYWLSLGLFLLSLGVLLLILHKSRSGQKQPQRRKHRKTKHKKA